MIALFCFRKTFRFNCLQKWFRSPSRVDALFLRRRHQRTPGQALACAELLMIIIELAA